MKKLLILSLLACFAFGASAQTSPGNSAFGHSHKKYHKHYTVTHHTVIHHDNDADRNRVTYSHRTERRTVRTDIDRNRTDRDRDRDRDRDNRGTVRQTTVVHKDEIRKEDHDRK